MSVKGKSWINKTMIYRCSETIDEKKSKFRPGLYQSTRELFRLNQVRSLVETSTLSWKSLTETKSLVNRLTGLLF